MLTSIGRSSRKRERLKAVALLLALSALPAVAQTGAAGGGPAKRIDARADQLLRKMCDYLGGLKAFTLQTTNTLEVIQFDGEKIGFESVASVTVQRPKIRSHRVGVDEAELLYDGKALTIYSKAGNSYATEPAPPTMEGAIDLLRSVLGVDLPGGDLLYSDAYAGLMQDVFEADYLGVETVAGAHTHHLAFRGREVDFQVWVEDGDKPLPRKYVITTKWMTGAPTFGISMTNWNLTPRLDDTAFVFTPPAGARKIDFLKMDRSPAR